MMKKQNQIRAKIYTAFVNGTPTQIKAYKKENAERYLTELGKTPDEPVHYLKEGRWNSHQAPVDSYSETGEVTYPAT